MSVKLKDKVAVITGGAGGIGTEAGRLFAAEGATVLLVDVDEAALAQACDDIGSNQVSAFSADVTRAEDNEAMVRTATERYGGVDIFLANAGIEGDVRSIVDYQENRFDAVMAVNVKGPFLGLKAVIPAMEKRSGGSIIITSSVAGLRGAANFSAYTTSKHAVIGLMRSAALECAAKKIRVNTVNPSPVETRMMRSIEEGVAPGAAEQAKQLMLARIPVGRYADSIDVARLMLFLASDDSEFITGTVHSIDGGSTA